MCPSIFLMLTFHIITTHHAQGLLIKPLLEKVMGRRGGRLPGFLMVVGDEESDDKMVEVSWYLSLFYCVCLSHFF